MKSAKAFFHSHPMIILHLVVFAWGFTGVLGVLISLDAIPLVIVRCFIAAISLAGIAAVTKKSFTLQKKKVLKLGLTGCLVGLHWALFYYSIKVSTVSIGLICISATTLFSAILEPLFYRKKISKFDVLMGVSVLLGILLIFKFEAKYSLGIWTGLASSFILSVFTILNKNYVQTKSALMITFYEMIGAGLFLFIVQYAFFGGFSLVELNFMDWFYLLILGTACTSGALLASVYVMKSLSAFTVALVTNLEPVYGVIIALIIFKEKEFMNFEFYLGSLIILFTVLLYPVIKYQWSVGYGRKN